MSLNSKFAIQTSKRLNAPTFRRLDAQFTEGTRTRIRLPIIINGAGPAGLVLAVGLQNAKIPFEICEAQRHDLNSKPRRNQISLLRLNTVAQLKCLLKFSSYEAIL